MIRSNHSTAAPAFWLSMHAGYACRDQGACCTAGWPIPIERSPAAQVRAAVADGRVRAPVRWLGVAVEQPADVAGVLAIDGSSCVFHRAQRCEIQAVLGHDALPSCCQHFPRDCVIDDRGVFVTLSHYCPTAAGLLFSHDGPLEIVAGPPPVPDGVAEGLDARGLLPPLLTRGVLMDVDGLTTWESHVVSWLGGVNNPDGRWGAERTLDLLDSHARSLSAWRPGAGATSLAESVGALDCTPRASDDTPRWDEERALRQAAREALVPPHLWPVDPADLETFWRRRRASWDAQAPVINRFLAAHAFASWTAFQGDGVVSGIRGLKAVLATLRAEVARACQGQDDAVSVTTLTRGIRQTDLLMRHLADRARLTHGLRELDDSQ